jgi:hypothetical protein
LVLESQQPALATRDTGPEFLLLGYLQYLALGKKVVGNLKAQLLDQVQQLFPPSPQLQAEEQAEEQAEDQAVEQPQQQETVVAEEPQQEAATVEVVVAVAVAVAV